MRIRGRVVVAVAAACFLFGGMKAVQAAAPPEIYQVYSTALEDGGFAVAPPTIVTVVGKSLTKFTGFTLTDSFGAPIAGAIDVLFKSKKMLVLRLPPDLVDARYIVNAALGTGDTQSFSVFVSNPSVAGSINDSDNPVDWSKLKGVPQDFVDGEDAWTEGAGNVYRASGRVGVGTTFPAATLHVSGVDGVLFEGTQGQGSLSTTGSGPRMIWYPGKSAFRAGFASGSSWDDGNIGTGSVALGSGPVASNFASFAAGAGSTASGNTSTALGNLTTASGIVATALGNGTTASGNGSTAMGFLTNASGVFATAMGEFSAASGSDATAMGYATTAAGNRSTAMNSGTTASGIAATAMGEGTTAQARASLALGAYNVAAGTADSFVSTDPVLVVGNGNFITASNAFTLLRNGNLTIAGTLTENSDERLKADVAPLSGVLRKIAGIRGVSYRMGDESRGPAGTQIGLLAQEVREVFPELVYEDAQGTLSVAYGKFSAVLLEAVREQQTALESRDREVAALRKELADSRAATEARLFRLEALAASAREVPVSSEAR